MAIIPRSSSGFRRSGFGMAATTRCNSISCFDLGQRESKFLIALDENHAFKIGFGVAPIAALIPLGYRDQPFSLVEPDCLYIHPCMTSQLPNVHMVILDPIPRYKASVTINADSGSCVLLGTTPKDGLLRGTDQDPSAPNLRVTAREDPALRILR